MKKFSEQFKGLNYQDPASWPAIPKVLLLLIIFSLVLAAAYFVDTKPQLEELEAGRAQERKLKDDYVAKYRQAVNLDLYKAQLKEVEESFGQLIRQLPDKAQMENLISDINGAGVGQGMTFELFKPAANESKKEFYAELPIALKLTGTYHQMGQFGAEISKMSRIVTLNDVSINVNKEGMLSMDATAKTFRYLDEAELAEQRKAAADSKKKKGKKKK